MFKIFSRRMIVIILLILMIFSLGAVITLSKENETLYVIGKEEEKENFIKYAEFNVTYPALKKAMKEDINSRDKDIKLNWIEILSYLAAKYGGEFKSKYSDKDMDNLINELNSGKSIEELTEKMKYYNYYKQVYTAVLGGFLGEFKIQKKEVSEGEEEYETKYGLKVYSPIAKTFPYQHFDDFGASRSYGYKRPHLGHDMMAATGTPVIAVESGIVEVMGWNQYGGWRIGIRSFDKKRYYYYAHLRKDKPFHKDLAEGKIVTAGDVIGYVGRTGYSPKENVNNIETSHLHIGLELIFDESQKECNNEIWVDFYNIAMLLSQNQSEVVRDNETKHFYRRYNQIEEHKEE